MTDTRILEGKKLLIVDDEPDVLDTLKELLDTCLIDTATDFRSARTLLDQNEYDAAVFDIMGVKGYDLLDIANKKGIPSLMLTAHALSPDNFAKSILAGAKAYLPKEKMTDIAFYLADFLQAQMNPKKPFKWFYRLKDFYESQFGKDWLEKYRELRDKYGPFYDD
ncbi:MAG: response regulator [Desulfobacterales bacterium]|nr:response regulator [Desulfobacterales bacterium]